MYTQFLNKIKWLQGRVNKVKQYVKTIQCYCLDSPSTFGTKEYHPSYINYHVIIYEI